jgi:excisionase family DNA binding protein
MSLPAQTRPLLAAPVSGIAAMVISRILDEHLPRRLVHLQRIVEMGRLDPAALVEVNTAYADLREAGRQWSERRISDLGSAEVHVAEVHPSSSEIDTSGAAELLGVSPRRVRQLIGSGELNARRASRLWLLDRSEVELRREVAGDGPVRRNARAFHDPRA